MFQSDYTLRLVSLGAALLGIISGVIGSFAVLKKQGLLGDAISHASLPGIAIMFIILQNKNTALFMLGALMAGLLATGLITGICRFTRIKYDSAMALVLSVFFGVGLVLMTYIQKIPNANQAGIDKFIFGQASTLLKRDVYFILIVGVVLLALVVLFWKEFKIFSFDPDYAHSLGFSTQKLSMLLSSMIVISVIIGLQTVGVILMSAMLVAPGVAARQWTDRLSVMVVLAGTFGAFSGVVGTLISSSVVKMPTGPAIVLIISVIVVISILMSPKRGLVWRYLRALKNQKDINGDQVLFNLYDLAMNHKDHFHSHSIAAIAPIKTQGGKKSELTRQALNMLKDREFVIQAYFDEWAITERGIEYVALHPLKKGGGA
ncbi:metal ABC transporter permease [Fusibacter sp. 3D3]|uniref:metal ABC transporter permease n=1 Tax=Fusibacter sp. 3D3 TaxID=1048380 RepID=UPI0035B554B5